MNPDDDIFFVLPGGPLHVYVDGTWHEAQPGFFIRVPGGTLHDASIGVLDAEGLSSRVERLLNATGAAEAAGEA